MTDNTEIWKSVPGYEDYQVSTLGKVRSIKFGKEKELKFTSGNHGYLQTIFSLKGKLKKFFIHQLVAMTFLDHVPNRHTFVIDHINSNRLDNRLVNLKIVTVRKNFSKERTEKSGFPTGVRECKRKTKPSKFRAMIGSNGKNRHIGYFSTPEEASNAYQEALKNLL